MSNQPASRALQIPQAAESMDRAIMQLQDTPRLLGERIQPCLSPGIEKDPPPSGLVPSPATSLTAPLCSIFRDQEARILDMNQKVQQWLARIEF